MLGLPIRPFVPVGAADDVHLPIVVDVSKGRAFGVKFVGQLDALPGDELPGLEGGRESKGEEQGFHNEAKRYGANERVCQTRNGMNRTHGLYDAGSGLLTRGMSSTAPMMINAPA